MGIALLVKDDSLVEGSGLNYEVDPNMGVFVSIDVPEDLITYLRLYPGDWIDLRVVPLTSGLIAVQ